MDQSLPVAPAHEVPGISLHYLWWVLGAVVLLIAAIASNNRWFLNFVHVFSALLWTGTDLFLGFLLGPVLRRIDFPARRAVTLRLMPRLLFFMPTVAIISSTSGWFLAEQGNLLNVPFPQRWWLIAAGVLVIMLTVQGLGYLLPTNLRVFLELRKEHPDGSKVQRLMSGYVRVVTLQGITQIALIVVMARFASGL